MSSGPAEKNAFDLQQGEPHPARAVGYDRFAHRLRSPVMAIRTLARLVGNRLGEDHPNRLLLEAIDRECRRLDELIDRGFTPATSVAEVVEMPAFLAALEPGLAALARAHGLGFSLSSEPVRLRADRQALREAVLGLVENAFKYTPAGGQVEVRCCGADGRCRIDVIDTGPGIAPEDTERIFEPYYRARSAEALPGQGLGLAIVRELAESLGGRVTVAPAAQRPGSVFSLYLPIDKET